MTSEHTTLESAMPNKNPIVVLYALGCLNLFAATLILVLQAGVLIVGKSIGFAHIALAFGWMLTGVLGGYLLFAAQALSVKRRRAIEESKRALGKEHTKEIHRNSFNFYDEKQ